MRIDRPFTILCVSSYFKGNRFIETCKREGCRTLLLTVEKRLGDPWARESIDEVYALPSFEDHEHLVNAVSYLARTEELDRIAPLDDFDVERVARLREHLRIPGMGETTARYFRDKLAMRARAEDRGFPIPRFVHVLNDARLGRFVESVPPPWMFKPRSEASSLGIRKVERAEDLWEIVESLGDRRSHYLVEEMIDGDLYHVDSIVWDREVVFAEPHRYRTPLFEVAHGGGIFATMTMQRDDAATAALLARNRELVGHLGMVRGVLHTEFMRRRSDGEFLFIETAARVGGAQISDLVEVSTGVNLWEEWAKIEIAQDEYDYEPPEARSDYAGLVISLAKDEYPDTSAFDDPEIVWRLDKKHHIGLIVRADSTARVAELIDSYVGRIAADYQAVLPPPAKPTD